MTGWRTMDSAPKDGTRIIGSNDDETVYVCAWFFDDPGEGYEDGDWLEYGTDVVRPTRWMPLPEGEERDDKDALLDDYEKRIARLEQSLTAARARIARLESIAPTAQTWSWDSSTLASRLDERTRGSSAR